MYLVYLIVNKINNKCYVGWTGNSLDVRWYGHCSDAVNGSERLLQRAIRKYGDLNFSKELICVAPTLKKAKDLEELWIITLRSYDPQIGYNMTYGGEGSVPNLEVRKKISMKASVRQTRANFRICYGCFSPFSVNNKWKDATFCSRKCAESDRKFCEKKHLSQKRCREMSIRQILLKSRKNLRICYCCFKPFSPVEKEQVFCSYRCRGTLVHYGEVKSKYLIEESK